MKKMYDAIVVGGGPGGITCAALLAKKGVKTLVLEKNDRVGGRPATVTAKGFTCERWPTGGLPVRGGSWLEAFKALGIESKFRVIVKDVALIYRCSDGKWSRRITQMDPYVLPDPNKQFFDDWQLNAEEREVALKVLGDVAMMTPEKLDTLDNVSVHDYLSQYKDLPQPLYGYFAFLAHAFNVGVVELVSMSECAKSFQRLIGQPLGYPAGGYGRLVEDMAEVLKANGGEVKTRARVEKIIIDEDRVSGVATGDSIFKAPIVVSNAGIHPTVLKLVGEDRFDKSYVSYVKDLLPSLGFTGVRYILNKPVLTQGLYQIWSQTSWWNLERYIEARKGKIEGDVTITMLVPTNYDPSMGPPGKQLVMAGTNCSPDPQDKTIEMLWKKTDQQIAEALPEMVPFIESKEAYAGPAEVSAHARDQVLPNQGGEAVGVGVTIGQNGKRKPSAKSPIPGLFYVGFDAGSSSGFMGTQQAVDSGLRVADMVYHYHLERRQALSG
jgi:phytoene dehydrogenase-like protein